MSDLDEIYRLYARTVYGFLLSKCRNSDIAEELVKDIKITGVSNLLFDYEDLLMNSNIPKLQKYIMDNQR